jgi:hypothetical protein
MKLYSTECDANMTANGELNCGLFQGVLPEGIGEVTVRIGDPSTEK